MYNWNENRKNQMRRFEFERFELIACLQQLREARKNGRPVDVLAVVDDLLDQLDRPVYRQCNNRRAPSGFADWIKRQVGSKGR
ncbi:MAG: hypothetical protein KDA87_11760 [Planctomycetales bacterium]|nr:hypothetical protein [Planctomycetales bacterium]